MIMIKIFLFTQQNTYSTLRNMYIINLLEALPAKLFIIVNSI